MAIKAAMSSGYMIGPPWRKRSTAVLARGRDMEGDY
jgi:hypothetical protein